MSTTEQPKRAGFQNPEHCKRCGARTRRGTPCQLSAEVNVRTGKRLRCRLHGSRATGARTSEGLARIIAANLTHGRRSRAYREAQRVLWSRLKALKPKDEGLKL
jgi:hypothetical protein